MIFYTTRNFFDSDAKSQTSAEKRKNICLLVSTIFALIIAGVAIGIASHVLSAWEKVI